MAKAKPPKIVLDKAGNLCITTYHPAGAAGKQCVRVSPQLMKELAAAAAKPK